MRVLKKHSEKSHKPPKVRDTHILPVWPVLSFEHILIIFISYFSTGKRPLVNGVICPKTMSLEHVLTLTAVCDILALFIGFDSVSIYSIDTVFVYLCIKCHETSVGGRLLQQQVSC